MQTRAAPPTVLCPRCKQAARRLSVRAAQSAQPQDGSEPAQPKAATRRPPKARQGSAGQPPPQKRGPTTAKPSASGSRAPGSGQDIVSRFLNTAPVEAIAPDPPGHKSGYVAIVGKPNAGKSTLLNALVGQKLAIVTAKPQTTRHRIVGLLSGPGHQGMLVDTPGVLAESRNALDGAMMRSVRTTLTQADVLCVVVDAAAAAPDPSTGLSGLQLTGADGGPPLCVLLNKCDLLPPDAVASLVAWFAAQPGVATCLTASAQQGTGVRELEAWLVEHLPLGPTLYPKDQVSEHPERFFVAEIVRERIFELYHQEVPYCTSVTVVEHRERSGTTKDFIAVQVTCERESQVPILLGKGGAAIKELSQSARTAIEAFLERPVFLDISVKVAPGWRDSDDVLDGMGINNASRI